MAPGCHGLLTSSSYLEGHGSTSQWEKLGKGHLLFLGEPDESREMKPFPVVSLGLEGLGSPSIKTSIDQDIYLSAGQREALDANLFQGSKWGKICLCLGQSNSHSLENSGKSSHSPTPALTQTFLSIVS